MPKFWLTFRMNIFIVRFITLKEKYFFENKDQNSKHMMIGVKRSMRATLIIKKYDYSE